MSFRKEEKLKIHPSQLISLRDWIAAEGGVQLHDPRTVSSTYFDNERWQMFHDSEEGCVPRKKIRIRSYTTGPHVAGSSALEVKISSIEGRFKTTDDSVDPAILMKIGLIDGDYGICRPKVRVTYQRQYYSLFGTRVTIDQDIEYRSVLNHSPSLHRYQEPEIAVEVKAAEGVPVEYLTRRFPFDRVRFSKYCRAVNCLFSAAPLKANVS